MGAEEETTGNLKPKKRKQAKKIKRAKKKVAGAKSSGKGSGGSSTYPRHPVEKALRIRKR
jgi:hypothetical protein